MKSLILSLALLALPASALTIQGNTIILDDAEMQQCASEGGCGVFSRNYLMAELQKAYEAGKAEASQTCKRDWRKDT